MKPLKDLTGLRFDKILVIKVSHNEGPKRLYWLCKCDCGKIWPVRHDALLSKSKPVRSCRCKPIRESVFGSKVGLLTVMYRSDTDKRKAVCLCDCGNTTQVFISNLNRNHTTSCGCLQKQVLKKINTTHGMTKSNEFNIWQGIKQRCYDVNSHAYSNYGGRGIIMCDRWLNSFENFYNDMGKRPSKSHTIDRFPNDNGNYEPENCRWATKTEQAQNRRKNVKIFYNGEEMTVSEFAKRNNIEGTSVYYHIKKMTAEQIVEMYKSKMP